MKPLIIIALCLVTTACAPMDNAEGKPSAFKAEVERRALLTLPEPVNLADGIAPAQTQTPPPAAPIVALAAVETCVSEFRQWSCVDNQRVPWIW